MENLKEKHLVTKTINVKSALIRLGKAVLSPENTLASDLEDEFAILEIKGHLGQEEAIAVSVLFVKLLVTKDVLYSALRDFDCNDILIQSTLDGLEEKGMISSFREDDDAHTLYYKLTSNARRSLLKGEPVKAKPINDCMQSLKDLNTFSLSILREQEWLRVFKEGFQIAGNEVFLHADKTLGLSSLPEDGQLVFWLLANHFIHHFTAAYNNLSIDDKILALLLKKGLVDLISRKVEEDEEKIGYVLSANSAKTLFRGMDEIIKYDQLAKFATIVPCSSITPIDLFFSPQATREINTLRKILTKDGFERASGILERKKRNPAIQSLLWGAPGTGKTEVARQLARETGRDLIILDVSRITYSGWGDSEKAYRDFFRAYSYVAAVSRNTPILLLNEADSILSKRLATIDRSIDKAENAVTDILLQEFETMRGILLATTNFTSSIDDAFDRRFLFKTELGYPDETAREHIWKNKIPELTASEAHELACIYSLTGAQIQNIAVKRELAELYYEGERGLSYIRNLCEEELTLSKAKTYKKIGF